MTTGRVLQRGAVTHACRPGCTTVTVREEEAAERNAAGSYRPSLAGTFLVEEQDLVCAPGGTVWQCECGRVWVKEAPRTVTDYRSVTFPCNEWRPETRRERRRRLRAGVQG